MFTKGTPAGRPQKSGSVTVQAPTGGLNAYNPISNMPENDAIILRNFFPEAFGLRVRKGYVQHATGMSGEVCSILVYSPSSGPRVIYAVDQHSAWDVTTPHNITGDTAKWASTNPWWQHTNFSNPSGTHMLAFNGADDGVLVNGTGIHRLVAGTTAADYTWVGIDPKKLVVPIVHQHRVWAVEAGSTRAWYLPPEQVWGTAKSFDFGANFSMGGFLQTLAVYTQDSGYGPDDYLAAISSAGEIVLYKGIDPANAASWSLVGVFFVGATFTRRCTAKFGGDVAVLTQYGMVTIGSLAKPDNSSVLDNALSQKIQTLISEVIYEGSYRAGWGMLLFPTANMMIINVPGLVPSQTLQLAYNTITKAWGQFQGMSANCFQTVSDSLMFGGDGVVYRAWEGGRDNVLLDSTGGTTITAECQQAFSYFQQPGANKHFKMFRPTFVYSGKFKYKAGANMDFDFSSSPAPASFSTSNFGVWDSSLWDDGSVWSGGSQSSKQWVSIVGIGYAAAIRISVETGSETLWVATDWLIEKGGVAG